MSPTPLLFGVIAVPVIVLPATLLAAWVGLRLSPRQVWSAPGQFRFRLYARATIPALMIGILSTAISITTAGGQFSAPQSTWRSATILLVVLLVPIQTLSEELLFRGVVVQLLGSALPGRVVGVAAGAVMSSAVFALVHAPAWPWVFLSQTAAGLLWVWLTDRTQGIEATSAAHAVWNTLLIGALLLGWESGAAAQWLLALQTLLADMLIVIVIHRFSTPRKMRGGRQEPSQSRPSQSQMSNLGFERWSQHA